MRYNYASVDCGARLLYHSPGMKNAAGLLNNSKDSYMLVKCACPDRHVVIELCQEVRIDSIAISNHEHFSSNFERVKLLFKRTLKEPGMMESWVRAGEWASDGKRQGEQVFHLTSIDNNGSGTFTRIIKIQFEGSLKGWDSFYCPVTSIKVFGKTMMEEYVEEQQEKIHDHLALMTISSDRMQLMTVLEEEKVVNVCTAYKQAPLRLVQDNVPKSDNVFKAINDRLCRLELVSEEAKVLKTQVDNLARVVVNLAASLQQQQQQNRLSLSGGVEYMNAPISRWELYTALCLLSIFVFFTFTFFFRQPNIVRTMRTKEEEEENTKPDIKDSPKLRRQSQQHDF